MLNSPYTSDMRMPLDTYYIELDWPKVPNDLCSKLIDHAVIASNCWEGQELYTNFEQKPVISEAKEWLKNNLPIDLTEYKIRLQIMAGSFVPIHKDVQRASSFNFVLTDDKSTTHWHDSKGKIIHSVYYEPRVWYHHQTQVPHSVENIQTPRIAITIYKVEIQEWLTNKAKKRIIRALQRGYENND
jgi:hypothetical protein